MLKILPVAEHARLPCRYRPLLIATACGLHTACRGHSCLLPTAQSSAAMQESKGIVQASNIRINYLLCKLSNFFFHCPVYM